MLAPDLRAFNSQYLLPQNVAPAAPGQGVPEPGFGSDDPNAAGRLAFLKRLHAMYQAGDLDGALLGQVPPEQLGEPLPGTAPGPGITSRQAWDRAWRTRRHHRLLPRAERAAKQRRSMLNAPNIHPTAKLRQALAASMRNLCQRFRHS